MEMFEGFENEAKRSPWRRFDRTRAAVVSFYSGKYQEAQKWLDKMEGDPLHERVLNNWGFDEDWIVSKTGAFTSAHGGQLQIAEKDEEKFSIRFGITEV